MTPAKAILSWCLVNNLEVESVAPDAMGGTDIYLNGINGTRAWICILDSGKHSIILSQHGSNTGYKFSLGSLEIMRKFLKEKAA